MATTDLLAGEPQATGTPRMPVAHSPAVVHDSPSARATAIRRAVRLGLKPILKRVPLTASTFARVRRLERMKASVPHPQIVTFNLDLGGVQAVGFRPASVEMPQLTILYFHGGGFFSGSVTTHRSLCEHLAIASNATVISVEYGLVPDVPLARAVRQAVTSYESLSRMTTTIVVAGDSAGGYLAAKVVELAKRRNLPTPQGLIGFSPLLSLDPDRTDKSVERVVPVRDALLPEGRVSEMREFWPAGDEAIEGFAAPLHAAAYITCPVHLVAAEDELLRPEVESMAEQLSGRGVPVELHIWRGMIHAFPSFLDLIPEGREAVDLAAQFASRYASSR